MVVRHQVSLSYCASAAVRHGDKIPECGTREICMSVFNSCFYCRHISLSKEFEKDMAVLLPVNRKSGEISSAVYPLAPVFECRGNQEIVKNVGKSSELPLIIASTRFK